MQNLKIRDDIRGMITEIEACDLLEKKHIKEAISWILSGENLFRIKKDAIPPKHLVSYCVVVDFKNKSVLLVDHKKSKLLLPTGGHVDVNETPLQTAKRELQEELDLILEPISFNKETIPGTSISAFFRPSP